MVIVPLLPLWERIPTRCPGPLRYTTSHVAGSGALQLQLSAQQSDALPVDVLFAVI